MGYVGQKPSNGRFIELDALTASATATYTLQYNSVNYSPESVHNLIVSINGVVQKPSSMSLSGSSLTVGATLSSSDTIDYVRVLGDVGSVVTPTDGSVTSAKLDTNIAISGNLDVGTIRATNGTTAMTIDSSGRVLKPSQPVFEAWYTGGNLSFSTGSDQAQVYNNVTQQGGTNYNTSTGKFTVPITGFYCLTLKNNFYNIAADNTMYHGLIQNGTGFGTDEVTIESYETSSHATLDWILSSTIIRKYTASDTLQPYVRVSDAGNGTGRTDYRAKHYQVFSGFLVG